jgi:deferrochelatase/peroxidase EfeB
MGGASVDMSDIQGIVRFGYGSLTEGVFFLLTIRDAKAARAWLMSASITTAEKLSKPPITALQVAFTRDGLQALGVNEEVLAEFSAEFLSGMAGDESRSRRLGDFGASSPRSWRWGGPGRVPHVLVMVYAQPGRLDTWMKDIQDAKWTAAFAELGRLSTSDLQGAEPFGFKDGLSQPSLDWSRQREPQGDEIEYGNVLTLGECVLGYPNEYGKYTPRPLLAADAPFNSVLPIAEDQPDKRDFGHNGTFLVLRQLEQDVRGFWRYVDKNAGSDSKARQQLAESMVGRCMDGTPLVPVDQGRIAGIDPGSEATNQFTYKSDPDGIHCPIGAHIRRANPRNPDLPASSDLISRLSHMLGFGNARYNDDVVASTRFHRMVRRGREYGDRLTPDEALGNGSDGGERGIHFICLVGNILRQFEFVQNSWMMGTKFNALSDESDPLLGSRAPVAGRSADTFSQPQETGVGTRYAEIPQFITVRGGAYFFLPSLSALRYLSMIGER